MILESAPFVAQPVTRVQFFMKYNLQATTGQFGGDNVDGGVLEIKIGSASYVDLLAAGGSFNAGEGYSRRVANTQGNPLGGRMAWAGISVGANHNATLPSSASGQTVRLRWRLGTSNHTANQGGLNFHQPEAWIIDSVDIFSETETALTPQTITFTSTAPVNPSKGTSYTPTATASSGLPVTFSIAASSSSVCFLRAGTIVDFNGYGTCVIQANQAGNASYDAAPQQTQTVTVPKFTDTIFFTSTAPVNPQVGSTYTPTTRTTYFGRTVTLSIAASSSSVCSLAGGVVTFDAVGTCVIQADQPGDEDFNPAQQVTQTVNVVEAGPSAQSITFSSSTPVNPSVGATYTPVATATSGLPVTFSIASGSSSVCSIGAADLVTFNATGSCVIQADQAGNASFTAAAQVAQTVNVVAPPVTQADVSVTNTDSPDPVVAGDNVTYTIMVANTVNLSTAADVSLTDNIPANTTFVSRVVPAGWNCADQTAGSTNPLSCTRASLTPDDGNQQFTLVVRVNLQSPSSTPVTNTAAVSATGDTAGSGNNVTTATTAVTFAASKPAVVRGSTSWILHPSLTTGGTDTTFTYGAKPLTPLSGDWDGNGSKTPGTFAGGVFSLSNAHDDSPADITFTFGDSRGFPVAGDFNGDGRDDVAVFRNGLWQVHYLGTGVPADASFSFGPAAAWPTVVPVAGDWNGDGIDGVGLYTMSGATAGEWIFRQTASGGLPTQTVTYGGSTLYPVVGDWNGDGVDSLGLKAMGGAGWTLSDSNTAPTSTSTFDFGQANDLPVTWR